MQPLAEKVATIMSQQGGVVVEHLLPRVLRSDEDQAAAVKTPEEQRRHQIAVLEYGDPVGVVREERLPDAVRRQSHQDVVYVASGPVRRQGRGQAALHLVKARHRSPRAARPEALRAVSGSGPTGVQRGRCAIADTRTAPRTPIAAIARGPTRRSTPVPGARVSGALWRYAESVTDNVALLDRGRDAFVRAAWREALVALSEADRGEPLSARDLEALGRSAYMVGDTDSYVTALERAHRAHLEAGDVLPSVRVAFWIGHSLLFRGQAVPAGGWFARAQRLFDESGEDGAERGWLLIPAWLRHMGTGDYESGYATAGEAADIARRFDDADLLWLARGDQGRALINMGQVTAGLRLVDEMFVVATEGQLSPVVTGIVYCNTIAYCVDGYALDHAREWTEALTRWCESQPEMEEHFGFCLVHRAELHHLIGSWAIAREEKLLAV